MEAPIYGLLVQLSTYWYEIHDIPNKGNRQLPRAVVIFLFPKKNIEIN